MTDTTRERAERYADDLLARYTPAETSLYGMRGLIAIAWLEGQLEGEGVAVQAIENYLARVSA